jgi:hypothetical protein
MAVDANGNIVVAVHKDGSLTRLAIRSDGNIYFTDPNFQAHSPFPKMRRACIVATRPATSRR